MDSKLYTLGEANEYLHNDVVNKPAHYIAGRKHEPISVIEDWGLGYHLGNTVKYISRAGRKDSELQDLKKAQWYLNKYIQLRELELHVSK